MSLIPWIDKADDQILTDKVRRDDKAGAYYPIITQLLIKYIMYFLTFRCSEKVKLVLDN